MSIRAPRAGTVVELGANLHVGRILRRTDFIALIGPDSWLEAHGLISEDDIGRLDADAPALFVPENLEEPARIVAFGTVSFAGVTSIDIPDLASHYGGGIAVRPIRREGEAPSLVPVGGHYRVSARLAASAGEVRARTSRGTIVAKGRAQSVASRLLRQVLRVLVRESGT